MKPLGIMGGTFDPVHYAHLRLAEEAADALGLERVRWIPSGSPGHRAAPRTAGRHRLEMVRLAVAGNPRFVVDAADAESATPGFTIDTLARLREELGPTRSIVFVIGADQLLALHTWRRWRELLDLAHFAVGARPGYALASDALAPEVAAELTRRETASDGLAASPAGGIATFAMTPLAISGSDIRRRLAAGRSVRYLLPREVLAYIEANTLYGEERSSI
ncbi:MAG: nicotinate-nucleotide adenylyltransferase [Burkholderiales bacterium]|nr:nicotinate-nucleotide adenylyltransferase [Burkholderiales bacterium]